MSRKEEGLVNNIKNLLQQDYRGVNIAVYALASTSLAYSIYKIRPVSKFSKATRIPDHFFNNHEVLQGTYAGIQHAPVRILVNHKAPIYLPFWHSSKPPLPVKLWGVDIVSGNAVSWIECVSRNKVVLLKPITRDNEDLVSTVLLQEPHQKSKSVNTQLDIGQKLVELGFARTSLPLSLKKNTIESQLAPALLTAEAKAKTFRNGIWSEILPPVPRYVVYWRKGSQIVSDLFIIAIKTLFKYLGNSVVFAFNTAKNLTLKAIRPKRTVPAS